MPAPLRGTTGPRPILPTSNEATTPRPSKPTQVDGFVNGGARPTAGDGDFLELVKSLSPQLRSPAGYEAKFNRGGRSASAKLEGGGEVAVPTGDGKGPSFIAEAGKPLTISLGADRLLDSTEKAELVWRMAPKGEEHVLPLSTGERDANGKLVLAPATIDVPPDVFGTMRLIIRTASKSGQVSDQWDPTNDALIAPKTGGGAIVFTDDWKTKVEGQVRAGEKLQLAYDFDRASALFGGSTPQQVTAMVSINGGKPREFPLSTADGTAVLPSIPLPLDATDVTVWFKGEQNGNAQFDSAFGKNFRFEVGPARDDADSSWKAEMLRSKSFPNLKEDTFVGIGPSSQRYNCIAWTIGVRDEWVWPGEKLSVFDALYAKAGFTPLDSLDASLDPSLEKVVVYGLKKGSEVTVTHGAKQDESGEWTSKLGTQPLIRHKTLEALNGPSYGEPVRIYVRARQEVVS
ncbi:MAG: DUF6209 family protein [Archangium sp.]